MRHNKKFNHLGRKTAHRNSMLANMACSLIQHFMLFSDDKIALDTTEGAGNEEFDEEVLHMRQMLKSKLVDLDLSLRPLTCLKNKKKKKKKTL